MFWNDGDKEPVRRRVFMGRFRDERIIDLKRTGGIVRRAYVEQAGKPGTDVIHLRLPAVARPDHRDRGRPP